MQRSSQHLPTTEQSTPSNGLCRSRNHLFFLMLNAYSQSSGFSRESSVCCSKMAWAVLFGKLDAIQLA